MSIRNFCLARGIYTSVGTRASVYVSPSNASTIVKSLAITNYGADPTNVTAYLVSRALDVVAPFLFQELASGETVLFQGWSVINDDDLVELVSTAAVVRYWLSGAVLPYAPGQVSPTFVTGAPLGSAAPAGQVFYVGHSA